MTVGPWSDLQLADLVPPDVDVLTVGPWSDLGIAGAYAPATTVGPWSALHRAGVYVPPTHTRFMLVGDDWVPIDTVVL